jgi:Zn-dependent protease with chaperone function
MEDNMSLCKHRDVIERIILCLIYLGFYFIYELGHAQVLSSNRIGVVLFTLYLICAAILWNAAATFVARWVVMRMPCLVCKD